MPIATALVGVERLVGTQWVFQRTGACYGATTADRLKSGYSIFSTDIGERRTARIAGTSVPAIVISSVSAAAIANVTGSFGATPNSNDRMPRAAA
jgi:hypothetical protein